MKKNLLWIGIASLMIALSGCGSTATKEMSADELVKAASEKMAAADSYKAKVAMNMKAAAQGQEMAMDMTMDMSAVNKPKQIVQSDTSFSMTVGEEAQNMDMTMYIEQGDTGYVLYQNIQDTWGKMTIADEEGLSNYFSSPQSSVDQYLELADSMEVAGEETIDGVDCYNVELNIPLANLGDLMASLGSAGASAESLFGTLGEGDFSIDMYITKEDQTLVKESVDLTDILKEALKGQEGVNEEDLDSLEFAMDITFDGLNSVPEIVVPEEALAAPEVQF